MNRPSRYVVNTASCPEPSSLRALLEDAPTNLDLESLTQHVGGCPFCQQALERLAAGDLPVEHFVSASVREQPSANSAYWQALRHLEQLGSRMTPAPTQTPTPEVDVRATTFLEPPLQPGHIGRLGHFEILRVIGQGGMGVVLQAFDSHLQREVAIKVLDPRLASDENARMRFCRESCAAAAVSDDHIVAVYQVAHEEDRDLPYLVMQFVDGESLEQRLEKQHRLPLNEIIRISMQIAYGLAAAHERGLIHRDVKPGNILLEKGTDRVKLTDFGLARAAEDLRLTSSGMVAGTPLYMAPEQARGEDTDQRADLFSLGIVMYEMATGQPPFIGNTALVVLRRLSDDPHQPLSELDPTLPDWFIDIVDKLLAKRPADRFQTAREVAQLLEEHWMLIRTSSVEHRACPRGKARRRMLQLAGIGVAVGVLLTLGALAIWRFVQPALPDSILPGPIKPWATLDGNKGPIWSVTASPDDNVIAVGTHSEGVKFWNPWDDRLEATFPETRSIMAVAYSADGNRLAVGSEDGHLRIYDVPSQQLLHALEHRSSVRAVAFSRDGTRVVTGTRSGMISLWDVEKGQRIGEPAAAHGSVASVAFSPDGKDFASSGEDGKAIIWVAATLRPRFETPGQGGGLWSVRFTPDGKHLATGGWDGVVRLWDTGSGKLQNELKVTGPGRDIIAMSFCPSGRLLAIACADDSIRLWNVVAQEERAILHGHSSAVTSVVITRDGQNLASGARDGTVRMWKIPPCCHD